jgi:hypothetical protein
MWFPNILNFYTFKKIIKYHYGVIFFLHSGGKTWTYTYFPLHYFRPKSLLVTKRISVFLGTKFMFSFNKFAQSAQTRNRNVPFDFSPFWSSLTSLNLRFEECWNKICDQRLLVWSPYENEIHHRNVSSTLIGCSWGQFLIETFEAEHRLECWRATRLTELKERVWCN